MPWDRRARKYQTVILESEDLKSDLMNTQILERQAPHSQLNLTIGERGKKSTSKCSFCRHYEFQRGSAGNCQLLNAPVRGGWPACSLGLEPFSSAL